jgi:hypothetical protein
VSSVREGRAWAQRSNGCDSPRLRAASATGSAATADSQASGLKNLRFLVCHPGLVSQSLDEDAHPIHRRDLASPRRQHLGDAHRLL